MRYIILIILLIIPSVVSADRVALEIGTGKLIEYQSGDAPLGTLTANAVAAGYNANTVIEKNITRAEWVVLEFDHIIKPALDRATARAANRAVKATAMQTKLGLTNNEWNDLKEALGVE